MNETGGESWSGLPESALGGWGDRTLRIPRPGVGDPRPLREDVDDEFDEALAELSWPARHLGWAGGCWTTGLRPYEPVAAGLVPVFAGL